MAETIAKKTDDGYSKRVEELRAKRRERGTAMTAGKNLSVQISKLDPRFEYRWVNEENLTHRQAEATFCGDWEFVSNKNGEMSDGRNIEEKGKIGRIVEKGIGKKSFLMRKPKELYQDDQIAKRAKTEKQHKEMRKRGVAAIGAPEQGEAADQTYTPAQVANAYKP